MKMQLGNTKDSNWILVSEDLMERLKKKGYSQEELVDAAIAHGTMVVSVLKAAGTYKQVVHLIQQALSKGIAIEVDDDCL